MFYQVGGHVLDNIAAELAHQRAGRAGALASQARWRAAARPTWRP